MIKNIIFDMGGVLIEWNPILFLKRMGLKNKDDIELIINKTIKTKYWPMYDNGLIRIKDVENKCLKNIPVELRRYGKELIYSWFNYSNPIEGMPELSKQLKKKGYRLFVLTNAGRNQPYYFRKFPYKHFDGMCTSAYLKKMKPDVEIFEAIISKYKLNKDETLFTDDMLVNVKGAKKAGISAILFKDTNKFRKDLSKYL